MSTVADASTIVPSVCPLDCPDRCSLSVKVEGGRIERIDGSRLNPLTDGYICAKVRKFGARVHGPLRLLQPAVRVGPKGPGARFEPVSWDEALGLVAERFTAIAETSGWEAVLPYWYGGSNGWLTAGALDQRLWNRLGTSRLARTFCAANTGAGVRAVYGDLASADPLDVNHADLVVLWGMNPSASGIHLVRLLRAVQERGGRLVVVDPRRTPLAARADLHLAPLPGTDTVLALALAHVAFAEGYADLVFLAKWCADVDAFRAAVAPWTPEAASEICGVPAAQIRGLAELYAASDPALVRCGWGLERTRNGTDAIRSVLSLPAVYGKFGVRGAGWVMSTSGGYRTDSSRWQQAPAPHLAIPGVPGPCKTPPRTLNMSELGRLLEEVRDPPIRALYVYDCNPVATAPDQGRVIRNLARDDLFTVVHEQVHTDTVDYADVVLPATTFLEHREIIRSYGGYLVQWAEPAIPPVGESRSNHAVIRGLAEALGLDEPAFRLGEEDLAREIAGHARVDFDVLAAERAIVLPSPVQYVDVEAPISLVGTFGAPRYRPPPADADFPLILVSPATGRGISSTGYESLPAGTAAISLHPDDALSRGISAGDRVRVWNTLGEVLLLATVDDDLRPGVASIPKGLWRSGTLNGLTSNALVPGHVDELGGGACYNDARVDVALAP